MGPTERLDPNRDGVNFDDISWTLEPLPRIESVDLLTLDADEIITYARDLQLELESMRVLLHESVGMVARLTAQLDRSKRTVILLNDTMRELRRAA